MEILGMGNGYTSDQGSSGGGENQRRNEENGSGCNYWTNERHLDFLSSMEETFVRNLMQNHRQQPTGAAADGGAGHHHHHRRCHRHLVDRLESLRLDRYVPDISESTLDCKTTAKNNSRAVKISDLGSRSSRRRHRERPPTPHPYKVFLDQVVPQGENNKAGDKVENESERVRRPQQQQQQQMII